MEEQQNSPTSLTVDDVNNDLGIGKASIYKIFHSEDFPAILQGQKFIVSREGYLEWKKHRHERVK